MVEEEECGFFVQREGRNGGLSKLNDHKKIYIYIMRICKSKGVIQPILMEA
jgi:hypothetical protein